MRLIKRGIYLVRFAAMESRDKVLAGHFFFDKKTLIMKAWHLEVDLEKEVMKTIPVWVQLRLALKF